MCAELDLRLRSHSAPTYRVELAFHGNAPGQGWGLPLGQQLMVTIDRQQLDSASLDFETYGRLLGQMLFGDPLIKGELARARAVAEASDASLRLRLDLDPADPEIHDLRWELLVDPSRDEFLARSQRVLLSRSIQGSDAVPLSLPAPGQLRVAVAVADPADLKSFDLAPIDAATQLHVVREALGVEPALLLGRAFRAPLTAERLAAAIGESDLLYLVCHGSRCETESYLWLEQPDGTNARLPGTELLRLVREAGRRPALMVLVSCTSGGNDGDANTLTALAPQLVVAGVPAVVAMRGTISQQTALAMMKVFLSVLRETGEIDRALAQARHATLDAPDWWAPALFTRLSNGRIYRTPGDDDGRLEAARSLLAQLPAGLGASLPEHGPFVLHDVRGQGAQRRPTLQVTRHFTGREAELGRLARLLKAGGDTAQRACVAITGIGGVGKSALAAELVHRYGRYFAGGVFWVDAADATAMMGQLAALALKLGLTSPGQLPPEQQAGLLLDRWRQPVPSLVIFDGCVRSSDIAAWLPETGGSRVVITGRQPKWYGLGQVEELQLKELAHAQSVAVLCGYRPELAADDPRLQAIARLLGGLPLALDLAGRWLSSSASGPDGPTLLLEHLQAAMPGWLATAPPMSDDATTLMASFYFSYSRLDERSGHGALARGILINAAHFPDGVAIPQALLQASLADTSADRWRFDNVVSDPLLALGLLTRAGDTVSIHPLVAECVRAAAAGEAAAARSAVLGLLASQLTAAATLELRRDAAFWLGRLGWLDRPAAVGRQELLAYLALVGRLVSDHGRLRQIVAAIGATLQRPDGVVDLHAEALLRVYRAAMRAKLADAFPIDAPALRKDGREDYRRALAILEPRAAGSASTQAELQALAEARLGLGGIISAPAEQDRERAHERFAAVLEEALAHYEQGWAIAERVEGDPILQITLAFELSYCQGLLGRWAAARETYLQAKALLAGARSLDTQTRRRYAAWIEERYSLVQWCQGRRAASAAGSAVDGAGALVLPAVASTGVGKAYVQAYGSTRRAIRHLGDGNRLARKLTIAQLNASDYAWEIRGCEGARQARWTAKACEHARAAWNLACEHGIDDLAAEAKELYDTLSRVSAKP